MSLIDVNFLTSNSRLYNRFISKLLKALKNINKTCNFVTILISKIVYMNTSLIKFLFFTVLFSFQIAHSQDEEVIEEIDLSNENIPFQIVEEVPIFPGCENSASNANKKRCMQNKITKHVSKKFNMGVVESKCVESKVIEEKKVCIKSEYWPGFSSGIARIYAQFKIDKEGNVTDINVTGPHEKLKEEAKRVVTSLPKMLPAMSKGEKVSISYTLPISLRFEE